MKVGDLVKHFLTEQIGIIVATAPDGTDHRVLWTTQGLSLFVGHREWCGEQSLEALDEAR